MANLAEAKREGRSLRDTAGRGRLWHKLCLNLLIDGPVCLLHLPLALFLFRLSAFFWDLGERLPAFSSTVVNKN